MPTGVERSPLIQPTAAARHGRSRNHARAVRAKTQLDRVFGRHTRDIHHVVYLRTLLIELRRYLMGNRDSLTNYGAAYRRGERVSTAHVESTVNQVINQRMCKKRQMRWTRAGAQYMLHARTAMINGELGRYTGVADAEREAAA
jgi:hypothetical protein